MYDITTIGSSLVDIFIHSHEFLVQPADQGVLLCQRYGDKIDVDSLVIHSGGGGSNTAVGFARAGFHTAVISETGRDAFSTMVLEDLQQEKVVTTHLVRERKEQTGGSVILIGQDGGRTVLVHRGAAAQLGPGDIDTQVIANSDWVHVSSLAGQLDTVQKIIQARETTQQLSWNPGKAELQLLATRQLRLARGSVSVLVCNAEEWLILEEIHEEVLSSVPLVVVTNGKHGGLVYQNNKAPVQYDSPVVGEVVDETGAGDAFCVGLVSGLLWGFEAVKAVRCGITNSVSVISQVGAKPGLLAKPQLMALA